MAKEKNKNKKEITAKEVTIKVNILNECALNYISTCTSNIGTPVRMFYSKSLNRNDSFTLETHSE